MTGRVSLCASEVSYSVKEERGRGIARAGRGLRLSPGIQGSRLCLGCLRYPRAMGRKVEADDQCETAFTTGHRDMQSRISGKGPGRHDWQE